MRGTLTLFTSEGLLAKRWRLTADGQPVKETHARMSRGRFDVVEFVDVLELAALLDGVTTRQAICCSLPHDGVQEGLIVTQATRRKLQL